MGIIIGLLGFIAVIQAGTLFYLIFRDYGVERYLESTNLYIENMFNEVSEFRDEFKRYTRGESI